MAKAISLTEFVDSRGVSLRVDREAGVIHGVKLLGPKSKNGRTYSEAAIRQAASMYEGAKVNVNHPAGAGDSPRSYQDRFGQIRKPQIQADGVYGDFHFNPKHPVAEQLLWDAEHAPENVGFSHNVMAKTSKHAGQVVVEEIIKVTSVDLVADPATTRGLFEHTEPEEMTLTLEAVKADAGILESLRKEWLAEQAGSVEAKAKDAQVKTLTEELAAAKKSLDEFAVKEAIAAKKTLAAKLITEAKLPTAAVTDTFKSLVENAADEAAMKVIIEDRQAFAKTLGTGKPLSKSQHVSEGVAGGSDPSAVNDVNSLKAYLGR